MISLLALRLLRHKRSTIFSFLLVYGFGFSAFLLVDAFVRGYGETLQNQSRELLEGDLRLHSRRALSTSESLTVQQSLPKGTRQAQYFGFLSMARTQSNTQLVQIRAISENYPLYGQFRFDLKRDFLLQQWKSGEVLLSPELCRTYNVDVGDSLWIGEKSFRVAAVYVDRPGGNFQFWELGGRIYMPLSDFTATGLGQKGSRIFRYQFFSFPENFDATGLRKALEKKIVDPEMEFSIHSDGDTDFSRTLGMVGGFLQLVALCVFWLAAAGGAFFFRHHLVGERKTIATLKSLGATPQRVMWIYVSQNVGMALLAAVFAIVLSSVEMKLVGPWITTSLGSPLNTLIPFNTMALGMVLLPVTALLFSLSDLLAVGRIPAATLFRPLETPPLPRYLRVILFCTQGLFFAYLSLLFSHSWILSTAALVFVSAGLGMLGATGAGLQALLWRERKRFSYATRIHLGVFHFGKDKVTAAFLALGFVTFATSLIPFLRTSLTTELSAPSGAIVPSLFLFDIQEEQVDSVSQWLKNQGAPLKRLSAMVRARLETVNGKPFRRDSSTMGSMEEKNDRQLRNRGFNLSFRDTLSSAESITRGTFWKTTVVENGFPEISVEKEYAKRLDFNLGDTLGFDVQGVPVSGRITSFRKVKWTSFEPNFFVVFQTGALEMAPKTFIGTIGSAPVDSLLKNLAKKFPGITALNVHEAVERILQKLNALEKLVTVLAIFALIVGLAMLLVVVEALARDLEKPTLLLKILGESPSVSMRALALHFTLFCAAAGWIGTLLGQAAAFAVCIWLWKISGTLDWTTGFWALFFSALSGLGCAGYALWRLNGKSPRALLGSSS